MLLSFLQLTLFVNNNRYDVPWPLHLVVGEEAFASYNKLFSRLLSVQRANYEIQDCWKLFMQRERVGEEGGSGRLAFVLRARIMSFVTNLLTYFKVDVVETLYVG